MVRLGLWVIPPLCRTPSFYRWRGKGCAPPHLGPAARGLPCPQAPLRVRVHPHFPMTHLPWGLVRPDHVGCCSTPRSMWALRSVGPTLEPSGTS